jgi:GT2 family glycosyltransferase
MTLNSIDLSVVIVSYNTLDVTRKCLYSILNGTEFIAIEVWVVDNSSLDGSAEMIARDFPSVHLIRNNENKGVAAATNQGLERSSGRYVLTMNSDVLVPPGCFQKLVGFMDEHPDAGGATPKLVLQGEGQHPRFIGNLPTFWSELLFALCLLHKKFADWSNHLLFKGCEDYSLTRKVPCVLWGTCFIVRREVLATVGMQDPRYFIYCEDWDWSIRIAKSGWNLYFIADSEVVHLLNQSTKSGGSKTYAHMWKSRCRLIGKNNGMVAGLLFRFMVAFACSTKCALILTKSLFIASSRNNLNERISLLLTVFKTVVSY